MKRFIIFIGLILSTLFIIGELSTKDDFPVLKGPYLGQKPPGMNPEVFAPGIVSTQEDEINSLFSPDGKEFYFSIDTKRNNSKAGKSYIIMVMKEEEKGWTKPHVVSFSGKYMDADMCISFDGKKMFFCSDRPLKGNGAPKKDSDIWMVEKKGNGWSEPKNLGLEVNSDRNEWYPSITKDGTIYFSSSREGGKGASDLYCSRYVNCSYEKAENLGEPINTQYREGDIFIAPDESYLIVISSDRPEGYGSGDLYISFRKKDGSWTKAKNMGEKLNTRSLEYCPMLSHDGKYLFFTSRRSGTDDINWVDAKIIEELKPRELQ